MNNWWSELTLSANLILANFWIGRRNVWNDTAPGLPICPESIEWFTGDHAFSPWYDLAPPPIPLSRQQARTQAIHRKTEKERQLADGRGGGSQILPRWGRLVFYKSCNTLCHCPIRDKPTQFSYLSSQRGGETMIPHIIPSTKFKCRMCTRTLKPNSWTSNFVEISGHNLESLRLQVSVYNVYITNHLQTTFAQGGGG